ncbi:cytochrome P450 family protein [Ceratobasidium sp. AG-Ba]|nr:cytochrome P450 family protein [Ceratobasidium sp. AG-Ba]
MIPYTLLAAAIALTVVTAYIKSTRNKKLSPPTVPGHWLFKNQELYRTAWRAQVLTENYLPKYGDIFQISTPSKTVVVLSSAGAVSEVLEKQAAVTSDRPRNVMLSELCGFESNVGIRNHDEVHKQYRRVMASALHPAAARSYAALHSSTAAFFLRNLVDRINVSPNCDHVTPAPNHCMSLVASIEDCAGRFIMRMTYGHIVVENDPLVQSVKQQVELVTAALVGRYWVNYFPMLRYVPAWFPGAKFKRDANKFREKRERTASEPFEAVLKEMSEGKVERPSYTSKLLELKGGINASAEDLELVKYTAEPMFNAGATTTSALVHNFLFTMSIYPEIAARVQTEIDAQVGRDRLPNLQDREVLPYTDAVLQEVMRCSPVAPLGLEHCTSEDIEIRGYTIKKGTTIEANIWALMHESSSYPDPHTFNPDRFLKQKPDPDPRRFFFGFGRRVCPGQHVANNGAFTMCAAFMSVFNINAGKETLLEAKSHEKEPWRMFTAYGVYEPKPFQCTIKPRDQAALAVLEACRETEAIQ